jgi:hypothetical protein
MKTILFIFIISLSLQADYLKVGSNYCVLDFYYENALLYYHKSVAPNVLEVRDLHGETFLANYTYDSSNDRCLKNETFIVLGLDENQYNFYIHFLVYFLAFYSFG